VPEIIVSPVFGEEGFDSGVVTKRSRQLLFFAGTDEGAGDLIVLEGEDT
jgi:hypothetical protein